MVWFSTVSFSSVLDDISADQAKNYEKRTFGQLVKGYQEKIAHLLGKPIKKEEVIIEAHSFDTDLEKVKAAVFSQEWDESLKLFKDVTKDEKKNEEYFNILLSRDASLVPIFKYEGQSYQDAIGAYYFFPREIADSEDDFDAIYNQEKFHYLLAFSASFGSPFAYYHLSQIFSRFYVDELTIGGPSINPILECNKKYEALFVKSTQKTPYLIVCISQLYLGQKDEIKLNQAKQRLNN